MVRKLKLLDTETKAFKSGQILNTKTYKAPNVTKTYDYFNAEADVLQFVRETSNEMARQRKYKDYKIQLVFKFKKGKYMSTRFFNVGDDLYFDAEYGDDQIDGFKRLQSFSINYIKMA